MSDPNEELLLLQRCLATLVLDPGADAFEADPAAFARDHGLGPRHQEAFHRFKDRLLFYRDSVRGALWEPMDRYLPLLQAILEEADAWEDCRSAFLATRSVASPFYRDVAPTFLGWLASSGWGQDRWPYLLQLTHFELVKELVEHVPEAPPKAMAAAAAAQGPTSASATDASTIASIVDSVMADLRPKIVEEIARKLAGK